MSPEVQLSESRVRRVWGPDGQLLTTYEALYTRSESDRRTEAFRGKPFECLPGNPPGHKVVGTLADGDKVRAGAVEQVWNDWLMHDFVDGDGSYEKACAYPGGKRNLEILAFAQRLYAGGAS